MRFLVQLESLRALRVTVVIALFISIIAGAMWILFIRSVSAVNARQADVSRVSSESVSLYADGLQMCQATRNILLDPGNPKAWANYDAAAAQFEKTAEGLAGGLNALFPNSELSRVMPSVKADFDRHNAIQRRIHEAARNGDFDGGKRILNQEDTPLWRAYKQRIVDLRGQLDQARAEEVASMEGSCIQAKVFSWVSSLLLAIGSLIALAASSKVSRRLRAVVEMLAGGARDIKLAASQVARTSQFLAAGATEQAASVEEVSASALEVKSKAIENRQSSESAAGMVTESSGRLTRTNLALDDTVAAIGEIDRSSAEIAKIIKVIDDIAFQTNILALNAAVEASRAGEAGLGFSVVADEVRNLAHRCAQAARDTGSLIESSILKAHDGKSRVTRVASELHDYVGSSDLVQGLVHQVSEGSVQQTQGIEQIVRALSQISEATQSAAAGAEQGAAAAVELDAQAKALEEIVDHLRFAISGSSLRGPGAGHSAASSSFQSDRVSLEV
jgi:methyl-accepting chemotaxis protein/methyl-accepting chemotaxis protein-1 (serine sensor receptor)